MSNDDDDDIIARLANADMPPLRSVFRQQDFMFDEVNEKFIKLNTGALLGTPSVNGMIPQELWDRVPVLDPETGEQMVHQRGDRAGEPKWKYVSPAHQLMKLEYGRVVTGQTWAPGEPQIMKGWKALSGGLLPDAACQAFNQYIPPPPIDASWLGDTSKFDELMLGYVEEDRNDILDRMAFNVQKPGEKINGIAASHGLQGHGKDLIFVPLSYWLGESLFGVLPVDKLMNSPYNNWMKSLVLVINETSAKEGGAMELYEKLKPISAAPPEIVKCEDKYIKAHPVRNVISLYLTTNHPRALFLEPDDRRVLLVPFDRSGRNLTPEFFEECHRWMAGGGWKAVIHMLSKRPLTNFKPMAPARMTESKMAVLRTIAAVRRDEIDEVIEAYIESLQDSLAAEEKAEAEAAGQAAPADAPLPPTDNEDGDGQAAPDEVVTMLKPKVIINGRLQDFAESSFQFDHAEEAKDKSLSAEQRQSLRRRIHYAKNFAHKMREHGYEPHEDVCIDRKWVKGIYVRSDIPVKERAQAAREAARKYRGLSDSGAAGGDNVVSIDPKRREREQKANLDAGDEPRTPDVEPF